MADSYVDGIVIVHVATFCVIFLLKCKEYTGVWTHVKNRNKNTWTRTIQKPFKNLRCRDKKLSIMKNHWNKESCLLYRHRYRHTEG